MRSLLAQGIEVVGLELDTAIAAYLLRPAEARYELGHLLEDYTSYAAPSDDPTTSGQLDLGGTQVSPELRAARDALAVAALVAPITANLAEQGMVELYEQIENPLVVVLARMEHVGIAVDRGFLEQLYQKLTADVARLGEELRTISGHDDLNVNSTIQLRQILFSERGLTPVKKTKTGASTDASSLEKLQEQWPEFIGPLLQYREVEKLRGTYGEGLLLEVAADGRIHATFNQTVARTGRLSSDRPNLHNIPVRRDEGRQFRRVFVPGPGLRDARRRLQPDRAALHRPPRRRSGVDRRLHRWTGHPQRHGGTGVQCRPERRDDRPALEGEDGLLWARLRDGGLRAGPTPQHPDRGGGGDPRRLLRGVPQRQVVHGSHGRRGAQGRATPRRCSAGAGRSPSCSTATGGSARPASARR